MYVIYDDFLTVEEQKDLLQYCERAHYKYGETDREETPEVGYVHYIQKGNEWYQFLLDKTSPLAYEIGLTTCYSMYVNKFLSGENPYFHFDNLTGVTFLYYPQLDYYFQDGGETQILIDGNICGVVPIPNRLLMFDSRMLHRATSFRDRDRFTIAIKYE